MELQEKRLRVLSEILQGILVVKLFGWESAMKKRVEDLRQQELKGIRQWNYSIATIMCIVTGLSTLLSASTFAVYTLLGMVVENIFLETTLLSSTDYFFPPPLHHFSGNPLQASVLFPALYLFGVVLWPLLDFPWGLSNLAAARTSVQRLRTFLAMEELPSLPVLSADSPSGLAVRISSGEFWWPAVPPSKDSDKAANKSEDNNNNNKNTKGDDKEKEEDLDSGATYKKKRNDNNLSAKSNEEQRGLLDAASSDDDDDGEGGNEQRHTVPKHLRSALRDIHFEVQRGALVAIVGEVGSGKSALLHSLLGELHRSKGEL